MKPAETTPPALPKIEPSDRLGAVMPVAAAPALEGADLTNVIVLARHRHPGDEKAPDVAVQDSDRPAPAAGSPERTPWTALVAAVLLLHLALVLVFMREPAPVPSVGIDSMSVEIVLGGQTEAGTGPVSTPEESAPSRFSPDNPAQPTERKAETVEPAKPELRPRIEPQVSKQREEPKPEETKTAAAEPEPAPTEPEPAPAVAEKKAEPKQAEPEEPKQAEEPPAREPPPQKEAEKTPAPTVPSPPSDAATRKGIGVGRSVKRDDYLSLVTGHLMRHQKGIPAAVRLRRAGNWTVHVVMKIDGRGNATSIHVERSSGIPMLDEEALAIVRRASPLPLPPPGAPTTLTWPIKFIVKNQE